MLRRLIVLVLLISFVACSTSRRKQPEKIVVEVQEAAIPGTVTEVWEEPIVDTVRVPGQIDPQGNYYRAPHSTIVEIYPGRVQEVQYPVDERSKGKSGDSK